LPLSLKLFVRSQYRTCWSSLLLLTHRILLCYSQPKAVALPNSIIDPDTILSLVGSVTSEADQLRSFVDMTSHLPEEIVFNKEDMTTVLEKVSAQNPVEPQSTSEKEARDIGEIVRYEDDVYYFSSGMLQDIIKDIVTPLAQSFGETRAAQLLKELEDNRKNPISVKRGARERRQTQKKQDHLSNTLDHSEPSVFPLSDLAARIVKTYPALGSVDSPDFSRLSVTGKMTSTATVSWNDSNKVKSIVAELCRTCFYSDAMRMCVESVDKQLERMMASRRGGLMSKSDPSFMRSIESKFEKNFPALCYNVQMFSKLVKSLDKSNELRTALERDFLISVGADFAKRITEYCLIKHDDGDDAVKFSFEVDYEKVRI